MMKSVRRLLLQADDLATFDLVVAEGRELDLLAGLADLLGLGVDLKQNYCGISNEFFSKNNEF